MAPGLFLFYVLFLTFPSLSMSLRVPDILGSMKLIVFIIGASVAGIFCSNVGDIMLRILDRSFKFGENADKKYLDSFCDAKTGAYDFSQIMKTLPPQEVARLSQLDAEEKQKYCAGVVSAFKETAKQDFQRKINLGLSLIPTVVSHPTSDHQKKLRAFLSGPESIFSFCRGMLPVLILCALVLFRRVSGVMADTEIVVVALVAILLWITVCIRAYAFQRGCQLAVWIGLGHLSQMPNFLSTQ